MTGDNPNQSRATLFVCCGAHIIQDGLVALQYVLLPILAQALGLNYAQVGLLRALSNSAMSLLELPSGILAERYGERRLLAADDFEMREKKIPQDCGIFQGYRLG